MLYMIRMENTNFYKIGYPQNIKKRMKSLQTGCPSKLSIIITSVGSMKKEIQIQDLFKDYKTRENSEWFEFSHNEILKKVCSKIKNPYQENSKNLQIHLEDLLFKKISNYKIKDIEYSEKKNRFFVTFGKAKPKIVDEQKRKKYNENQRIWYAWRKRAKKVNIKILEGRRPTPLQIKKWKEEIIKAEHLRGR